ncbi:MAG: hypothetical protein LUH22_11340 [Bacteroides sp.]|nr:hypothetical protein [Bacteroides sp.]
MEKNGGTPYLITADGYELDTIRQVAGPFKENHTLKLGVANEKLIHKNYMG